MLLPVLALLQGFVAVALAWNGWSTDDADLVMGMNVGSYFVPEMWMMEQYIYCKGNGATDAWSLMSLPNVDDIMTQHLDNFIREVDFADAQARGVNMVRISVAFWMFIPTEGDEPYWTSSRQKDFYLPQLLSWASKYGMEVIIDLHAMPGGQNTDEHSGRDLVAAGLQPTFYNSTNLLRGNATIDAVIEWVQGLNDTLKSTVAIIEIINEPSIAAATDYGGLVGYYIASQAKIASALPDVWTMIGDAWLGTQSWGDIFNPSQKVVMDLHWWLMFADPPPTLQELQVSYCSLSPATENTAWKNPILVGEFAANQDNGNLTSNMSELEQVQFYQMYYSTQLWAARGSAGRLPLYRGGVFWSMICTNCADVWQPYYVTGEWDTMAVTEPNWCNISASYSANGLPTSTYSAAVNPSPTHSADSCGIYQAQVTNTGTATGTTTPTFTGATPSGTQQGVASRPTPSNMPLMLLMLVVTIFCVALGQSLSGRSDVR